MSTFNYSFSLLLLFLLPCITLPTLHSMLCRDFKIQTICRLAYFFRHACLGKWKGGNEQGENIIKNWVKLLENASFLLKNLKKINYILLCLGTLPFQKSLPAKTIQRWGFKGTVRRFVHGGVVGVHRTDPICAWGVHRTDPICASELFDAFFIVSIHMAATVDFMCHG